MDIKDTIDWYDENAEIYARAANSTNMADAVSVFLKCLPPNPLVLDAGCGSGRDSKELHKGGAKVIGIDISKGMLKIAQRDNPDIEFVHGDITNMPFEDNRFDGVWAQASLVHMETIEEAKQALKEFYRVLKPGGHANINVKMKVGNQDAAVIKDTLLNHDRFFRFYDPDELAKYLEETGFINNEYELLADPHNREDTKWASFLVQKPK
ncbi:MAG TPA: class I SAM-dependent methyltransferase [Candidatus Paceibacterota bacterium]|nr:class I SAM-dependent methyltransferase [Candidatus Paceibacterota bacterium]